MATKVNLRSPLRQTEGQWLSLVTADYEIDSYSDKFVATREFVAAKRAVAVMVHVPDEQKALLVQQFRYPVYHDSDEADAAERAWVFEVVAGLIDGKESPVQAMAREVKEETGIDIGSGENIKVVAEFYSSPGMISERTTLGIIEITKEAAGFWRENLSGIRGENGEFTIPQWFDYDHLKTMASDGRIIDAKTLIAIGKLP